MAQKRDYYEVLELSQDATQTEVKSAYRRLAREHHPDVNQGDSESEARFKEINEAYQVLSDPERRAAYDHYGHAGVDQAYAAENGGFSTDFGFGDIFDMFFGGGGGQRAGASSRPSAQRGNDLRYDIELTLEEAATGVDKDIRYARMENCETCAGTGAKPGTSPETCGMCHGTGQVRQQQQSFFGTQIRIATCPRCQGEGRVIGSPCEACSGQGRVRKTFSKTVGIPAGVDNGMRIRLAGEGDAGLRGGPSGDLYIMTHVHKHNFFERRGNDLWCEVAVGFALAGLGGMIDIRTIDGETEELEISAGTQPGEVYTLRGKGMPDPSGRGKGDLNVVVKVETPTKLNEEQKKLLHEFAELRGEEIREVHGKGFFERVKDAFNGL